MALNDKKRSRSTGQDVAGNTQRADDFRPLKVPRRIRQLQLQQLRKATELTSFPFMRLPLDLRMEIYEHLLQPKNLEIKSSEKTAKDGSNLRRPVYRAASLDSNEVMDRQATAILRTCKQIHGEALPVLYRPKKLTLVSLWLDIDVIVGRCKFNPRALSTMFRLETLHIDLNLRGGFRTQMLAHSKGLAECINESLAIRRVIVSIDVRELEVALRSRAITKDPAARDRTIADQVAVLQVWRDRLARAHRAEHVEIRYAKNGRTLVTWIRAREEEWTMKEIWDEDTADDDWRSTHKRCYNALVPAAMEIFGPCPDLATL